MLCCVTLDTVWGVFCVGLFPPFLIFFLSRQSACRLIIISVEANLAVNINQISSYWHQVNTRWAPATRCVWIFSSMFTGVRVWPVLYWSRQDYPIRSEPTLITTIVNFQLQLQLHKHRGRLRTVISKLIKNPIWWAQSCYLSLLWVQTAFTKLEMLLLNITRNNTRHKKIF